MQRLSRIEIRPLYVLGALAVILLLIDLCMLASGARSAGASGPGTDPAFNAAQQRGVSAALNAEIEALNKRIAELTSDLTSFAAAQEKTFTPLFTLANANSVEIRSVANRIPDADGAGSAEFGRLVTRVEMVGARTDIIAMLKGMREIFGDEAVLSDVSFAGPPEEWVITFNLTQVIQAF